MGSQRVGHSWATSVFFSLRLVFVNLISICLGVFLLGFILYGTLCASWTWLAIYFSMWGNFNYNLFKHFLIPFLFFFFFWDPYNSNVGVECCTWGLWDCTDFFLLFFLYSTLLQLFLPFYLPAHLSILPQLLFYYFPLVSFLFSYCVVHCWLSVI